MSSLDVNGIFHKCPAYLEEDREYLINAIAGEHNFAIKTARSKKFIKPEICISKKKVCVMSQPEGTLMSVAMDDKGATIPEAKYYFQASGIIFDAGFETLDLFNIENRALSSKESFSELGMREVFKWAGVKIKTKANVVIRPSAMKNLLEKGSITIKKRNGLDYFSKAEPIAELLEEASQEVCRKAVEKTMNVFSELLNYDYLILAGETSSAWETYIRNYFSQIEGLSIVMGNVNCPDLDMIFSYVRVYYMYLINSLIEQEGCDKMRFPLRIYRIHDYDLMALYYSGPLSIGKAAKKALVSFYTGQPCNFQVTLPDQIPEDLPPSYNFVLSISDADAGFDAFEALLALH